MRSRLSGCKSRFPALPLLTYFNIRCAAVLGKRDFRRDIRDRGTFEAMLFHSRTKRTKQEQKDSLFGTQSPIYLVMQRSSASSEKLTLHRHSDLTLGWCDPVGIFVRLQGTVKTLIEARDNFRVRMDNATSLLVGLHAEDFPERIRGRATKVLGIRSKVRRDYGPHALFHFEQLKPKEREALINDIISLYEACLIDLGKAGYYDVCVYPKDHQ